MHYLKMLLHIFSLVLFLTACSTSSVSVALTVTSTLESPTVTPSREPPASTPIPEPVDTATPVSKPTNTLEPTATPAYIEEKDLVYGKGGDVELKLNLARPTSDTGSFPALIFLFGGGYHSGSKEHWRSDIKEAAKRGYVAVTIDYRLTNIKENGKTKYPFPAQIHDGKCAVRWLRANASKYKIDPNRIGVVGFSAGGNLALMLGLTDSSDGLEGDCGDGKISSRVQAVVNLAGPTDLQT
jgi:acetyl esterase/lipase